MERGLIAFPYFRIKLNIEVEELVAFGVELMDDVVVPHPVGAHEGFVGDKAPDAMLHQELSLCQTRQRLAFWIPRIPCDSVPSSVSPEKISGLVETSDLLRFFRRLRCLGSFKTEKKQQDKFVRFCTDPPLFVAEKWQDEEAARLLFLIGNGCPNSANRKLPSGPVIRGRVIRPNQGFGCIIHLNIATCKWWLPFFFFGKSHVSNGCKMYLLRGPANVATP